MWTPPIECTVERVTCSYVNAEHDPIPSGKSTSLKVFFSMSSCFYPNINTTIMYTITSGSSQYISFRFSAGARLRSLPINSSSNMAAADAAIFVPGVFRKTTQKRQTRCLLTKQLKGAVILICARCGCQGVRKAKEYGTIQGERNA